MSQHDNWILNFDGSSSKVEGSGVGVVLRDSSGTVKSYHCRLKNLTTCNEAEYAALISGLKEAKELGIQ